MTGNGICVHIPLTTNMLDMRVLSRNYLHPISGISLAVFNKAIIPLALEIY